jgi:hypothetical protein
MIDLDTLVEVMADLNPQAWFLEPTEMYNPCIIGITKTPKDHWPRRRETWVLIYDAEKCIEAIAHSMLEDGEELVDGEVYEDAAEWFSFNTSGAWMDENTPTFKYVGWEE